MAERSADRFLAGAGWGEAARLPLPGDASFRRYVRLVGARGRAMLMDAPPPQENVRPFLAVARLLHRLGLTAPQILAEDADSGFLLLEDFGDDTYTRLLAAGTAEAPLPTAGEWEKLHADTLDAPALKKGLKLLWFATGSDDRLMSTTQATVDLLHKHGFSPVFKETTGGHTWINWRNYLVEFAPQLFQARRPGTTPSAGVFTRWFPDASDPRIAWPQRGPSAVPRPSGEDRSPACRAGCASLPSAGRRPPHRSRTDRAGA